jgi:DNA/RNA-binding domain of Phe-tRNA-synthetase-like protein
MSDPVVETGWVDAALADEFPELRLHYATLTARAGRSPRAVRERLRMLSDRFHGGRAIMLRQDPVPAAYRIFFRHIGLDPDTDRTPIEAAALERLLEGGFVSRSLVEDALLIALVETGVPIWALDGDTVEGPLGVRLAASGERLGHGTEGPALAPGRLVVADAAAPLAILFGDIAQGHGISSRSTRMTVFSVQVAGVPAIHVEEALWLCGSVLAAD